LDSGSGARNTDVMKIKTKLTVLLAIGFLLISVISVFFIDWLFNDNRKANFVVFRTELLDENNLSMDESAELFFDLIDMKFLAGVTHKEVLEYIKEIDQLNRAVVVMDYNGSSLLQSHSRPELVELFSPGVIDKQVQELHSKSRKNFSLDNYPLFLASSQIMVPCKISCRIYNASKWIIGYGKVMDSVQKRLLFVKRENDRNARTLMGVTFLILVFGVFLIVIAVLLFSRKAIFQPLEGLIGSFDRVSDGDLMHRIEVTSKDEMGHLAVAFNNMTENLSNNVHEIRAVNIKLDNYSRELGLRVERRTKELSEMVERLKLEVDERKRAEEQLQIFELALKQSIDGVLIVDPLGTVKFTNQAWNNMHRIPSENNPVIGQHVSIFHSQQQFIDEMGPFLKEVFEKGSFEGEIGHVRRDGEVFPTWMSVTLIQDKNGQPIGRVAIARDITEAKAVANQLQEARLEAESANRAKSQFLANMSHEIRTPMNAIIGMAELILDTALTAEQEDYAFTLKTSAESLLNLLNDILDLSKIEVGKLDVEPLAMDVRKCVADVVKNLLVQAQRKGLELIFAVDWNIPPMLIGDPGRLGQILTNLVGNSIKFTEKGQIVVQVALGEAPVIEAPSDVDRVWLYFTVSDTGIGIPADKQQVIFDKFTQTDSSITRKYGGSGLGLTISRELVHLLGGSIGVHSPGDLLGESGSTFYFYLPLILPTTHLLAGEHAHIQKLKGNSPLLLDEKRQKINILVAEDNLINQKLILRILEKQGFLVDIAYNGRETVEKWQANTYDLILMDIQMPEMDGLEATRLIRKREKEIVATPIPVIALTAHAMKGDRERFMEAGMNSYISKPIKQNELMEAIEKLLLLSANN